MASCRRAQVIVLAVIVGVSGAQNWSYYEATGLGGEKATLEVFPVRDDTYMNFSNYRQDVCERYELFRTGKLPLRDALRGLELTASFHRSQFFEYSRETGISPEYPGLTAHLLDMVADRAGFTWRNSFAVMDYASQYNMTWTEMLWWSINTYDIGANWWDHTLERMELGVSFVEPWYDASLILLDKLEDNEVHTWDWDILWNWVRPFETEVWMLILSTIIVSGVVYQFIEHMQGERGNRSMYQWFTDNLYLSFLNFTSNFEYAPATGPGRIFAVSMAMWALVISATYTANLANLFVDQSFVTPEVKGIEDAGAKKVPVCTFGDSNSDELIKERYKAVERRPQPSENIMFTALRRGECNLMVISKSGWEIHRVQKAFNPDCNLARVGETIAEVKSGFAVKPDVGYRCTSLVRDVLNLFFKELIEEGELDNAWKMYKSHLQDIDCDAEMPGAIGEESMQGQTRERRLACKRKEKDGRQRRLRSTAGRSSTQISEEASSLNLQQMIGTFILHYGMMVFAVVASLVSKHWSTLTKSWGWKQPVPVVVRSHGPTIGVPPSVEVDGMGGSSICAHGFPIGRRQRHSINTYIIPESGSINAENSNLEEFNDEPDTSSTTHSVKTEAGTSKHAGVGQVDGVGINDMALSRLQKHFDNQLQQATEHYEAKLEQQMGLVLSMLQDMRKEGYRQNVQSVQEPQRSAFNSSLNQLPIDRQSTVKTDFGHYLRPRPEKRSFGRYLRQESHESIDNR